MSTYQLGQTLQFTLLVTSDGTTLADLGGGDPTATITLPDGTTDTATVTKTATGTYLAAYSADTQVGRYWCTFTGSGTNSGALPYTDLADVWPANPRMIISLADARAGLNLGSNTNHDDELRAYIAAATAIIERIVGPVLPDEQTETHDGHGGTAILLDDYPTAVSSVTVDGDTVDASLYEVGSGAVLWRTTGVWTAGHGNIVVTYTVGGDTAQVPPNVILAAREQVRFLWQMGQTGGRPSVGAATAGGTGYTAPIFGYGVPNRVRELLGDRIDRPLGVF